MLDTHVSEWVLASGRAVSRGGWVDIVLHVVAVLLLGSEGGGLLLVVATLHIVVRGHRHRHCRNI